MNLNHHSDKHLLDQIDKRLESGQPSGNAFLDELASTRPISRSALQNTLEERLLAQLETLKQGENSMASTTSYMPIDAPRRNWIPLTLLAALMVVAIAGLMLINGIGKSPTSNEIALAQVTATVTGSTASPIPIEKTPSTIQPTSPAVHNHDAVQIHLSALTSDSLLPGVGGSVDVVALLPFKADTNLGDIPTTPMPDGTQFVETYVLRNTLVLYHGDRSQPDSTVTISVSPNDSRILAWLAEQPNVIFRLQNPLPNIFDMNDNSTIISIPIENVTASENLQPGDRVNVISTCAFVPDVMGVNNTVITSKTDCSQPVEETRAVNVQIYIGEIVVEGRQPVLTYDSIALVMPKEMTTLFTKLNATKMHFKLIPSTKAQPTPTPIASPTIVSTVTPTPIPTVRIVVAYQNLSRGFFFPDNKVDMQTVAYYAAWPADSIPFDALREDTNGIEQLQGKRLHTDIYSQQPITLSNLEEVHSSASGLNAINILPSDRIPVELSRAQITNDGIEPVKGDWVNIVALIPLEENTVTENLQVTHTPDGKRLIDSRVAFGALVAFMGSFPKPEIGSTSTPLDPSKITFGVAPDQAGLLTWLATQGITFKLELIKSADVLLPTPALLPPIPTGKITIGIPLASIQIIPQITDLQAGKSVDVIATFLSVDNDDSTLTNPPQVLTLQPGQITDQITKRIAQGAVIINAGYILTLAVSPDEAKVIQGVLDAKLPIQLRPVPSADTVVSPPSYSINLNLDSVSHWAADDLQVGDKVDVIVGLVLGNDSSLKLEFKPFAEYNWVGTPFNGTNSARTYIPVNPNSQSGAIFLRRILQNATVIAISSRTASTTGQVQAVGLTIEVQSETASTDGSSLKQWVDVGMPYLVVKH